MGIAAVIVAFALLLGFFVWEGRSRKSAEASSFARGKFDRGSTTLLVVVFSLGFELILAALILNWLGFGIGRMSFISLTAWVGVVVMLGGVALRVWANETLGRYFTRTLRVQADQTVVSDGPYRLLRHPGYLGDILLWSGAAFTTLNWVAFVIVTLAAFLAYNYRIHVEETMLQETLGAPYRAYAAHTKRLIPFIY
jgi:protein-S-isoprenylcysteine O-methyltransferase